MNDQDKAIRSALLTAKRAAGGPVTPPLQQRRQLNGSNMYSHAAEAAQALPQAKGQPQQMLASLKGVKPEEIANSGAAQAFAGQPSVTREQLAQHFQKSAPQIKETPLGEYGTPGTPKFEEYTIPGGENYRELLMHTPPAVDNSEKLRRLAAQQLTGYRGLNDWHHRNGTAPDPNDPEYARLHEESLRSQRAYSEAAQEPKQHDFISSHWDVPNVVAHLRMSDRHVPSGKTPEPDQKIFDETLPGTPERHARLAEQDRAKRGDKVLHLEELQSDWGQAGREKGFKEDVPAMLTKRNSMEDGEERQLLQAKINLAAQYGAPRGPYVTSTNGWTDLGLKRALTEAARGKYDRLAWTPGQEQGERYGLAKKLSHLAYHPGVQRLLGTEHGASHPAIEENDVTPEKLPSYVGRELAERLLASEKDANGAHSVTGDDLKVGDEGMKGYYDKILPGRLKEILKKLGHEAKFEPLTIKHPKDDAGRTEHTLHSVPLPPELREKILKGLPAYAAGGSIARKSGGEVTLRAAGVMLRDPEDRILFVKRNPKGGDHGGQWAFPGGKIEHGETPADAAARETHEEIGHRIGEKLGKPIDKRVSREGVEFTTFEHRVGKQFAPKLNGEHSEFRWAHPNSAPAPLHPGAKETLAKAYADGGSIVDHALRLTRAEGGPIGSLTQQPLQSTNTLAHDDPQRAANLRKWFGNSKVVDETGRPKVVYKGMSGVDESGRPIDTINRQGDFPAFHHPEEGTKIAGFFASDPEVASRFSGMDAIKWAEKNPGHPSMDASQISASVFPVHLKMEKPYEIDAKGKKAGEMQFFASGKPFRDAIRGGKHDGVIIRNTADEGDIYVALKPEHIKSAIGNNGRYDPEDPSIVRERGGSIVDHALRLTAPR